MKPAPFKYYAPTAVEEALAYLAEHGYDAKALAGGQSLIPMLNFRLAQPSVLVDLNNISELSYIHPDGNGGLRLGAMTRQRTAEFDQLVAEMRRRIAGCSTWPPPGLKKNCSSALTPRSSRAAG